MMGGVILASHRHMTYQAQIATNQKTGKARQIDEDLAVPKASDLNRERRGPFRPQTLYSPLKRNSGLLVSIAFRTVDIIAIYALAVLNLALAAPHGLASAVFGDVMPFLGASFTIQYLSRTFDLYRFGRGESLVVHMIRLALALCGGLVVLWLMLPLSPNQEALRAQMGAYVGELGLFLISAHLMWWALVHHWHDEGVFTPNIVIVGATDQARKIIETGLETKDVNILGVFDDRLARNPVDLCGVPVLGSTHDLITHRITPYIDQIVVAVDPSARNRVRDLIERLKSLPNEVALLVDMNDDRERKEALRRVSDMPLAKVSGISRDEARALVKRAQDLIIGALALILLSPLMAVIATLIKFDSPGPVFFRQKRHGFNNQPISVWKFRSMRVEDTDHTASIQVRADDVRVTRFGRLIRKTSLDELPQLFNVLAGDMSLVGPRPHAIGMMTGVEESARLVGEYAWRHRMKPGMTGWAAIHGSRGPMDTAGDVHRRVALDVEYIERQSFWLDLYIMVMTIPCLLGDRDVVR